MNALGIFKLLQPVALPVACSPRLAPHRPLKIPGAATDPLAHTWISAVGDLRDVQEVGYGKASKAVVLIVDPICVLIIANRVELR